MGKNLLLTIKLIQIIFTQRELIRLGDPSFRLPGMIKFTSSFKYLVKNIINSISRRHKISKHINASEIICDSGVNEGIRRSHLGTRFDSASYITKSMSDGWPGLFEFIVSLLAIIPLLIATLIMNRRLLPASNIWTWFSLYNETLNICKTCSDKKHLYLYGLHQANHNWIVLLLKPNVTSITSDTPLSAHSKLAVCHNLCVSQNYQLEELKLIDSLEVTGKTSLQKGHSGITLSVPNTQETNERYGIIISSGIWLRILDKKPFDFDERVEIELSLMNRINILKQEYNVERILISLHPREITRPKETNRHYKNADNIETIGSFKTDKDLIMNADFVFGGFTTTSFDIIEIASKMKRPPVLKFFLTSTESKMAFTRTSISSYFIKRD